MKILAIDSSGIVASVAVVENDNLLGEYTINYKKNALTDIASDDRRGGSDVGIRPAYD